eukprot:UN05082
MLPPLVTVLKDKELPSLMDNKSWVMMKKTTWSMSLVKLAYNPIKEMEATLSLTMIFVSVGSTAKMLVEVCPETESLA